MRKLDNEGITLVEVLAVLTLVSIIAVAAWTALSIGMKYTTLETSKTEMQQDANIIISKLSSAHRQSDKYAIKIESEKLMISTSNGTVWKDFEVVLDKPYSFAGTIIDGSNLSTTTVEIEPKKEHADLDLKLTKNGQTLDIQTTLTRIRTDRP